MLPEGHRADPKLKDASGCEVAFTLPWLISAVGRKSVAHSAICVASMAAWEESKNGGMRYPLAQGRGTAFPCCAAHRQLAH
jgi:hypothetical protein